MVNNVHIDYDASQKPLMEAVKATIVQQDDYAGMGMHGSSTHGGTHEEHSQASIRLGETQVNFRELASPPPIGQPITIDWTPPPPC